MINNGYFEQINANSQIWIYIFERNTVFEKIFTIFSKFQKVWKDMISYIPRTMFKLTIRWNKLVKNLLYMEYFQYFPRTNILYNKNVVILKNHIFTIFWNVFFFLSRNSDSRSRFQNFGKGFKTIGNFGIFWNILAICPKFEKLNVIIIC